MVMYGVPAQVIVKQTRGLPPLYPINMVYRLLPCFGLIGFACTFNAFTVYNIINIYNLLSINNNDNIWI